MFAFSAIALLVLADSKPDVYKEYPAASKAAKEAKTLLVVEFGSCIDATAVPEEKARTFVWCRVDVDYRCSLEGASEKKKLLDDASFSHLSGERGIAIVDYRDNPHRGNVVSVLTPAFFKPGGFLELLDLPVGSLESRTLIWAARRHPTKPASAFNQQPARLHDYAMNWARHQASINKQYHSDILAGGVRSENVAETFSHYPGLLEGAEQLIYMWSQSEGHWTNMCKPWQAFGYGMAWSPSGNCWFGCQVFDDQP